MPIIANERDIVFRPLEEITFEFGDGAWYDFYVLLGVERTLRRRALEEAIVSRGADLLALNFSRGGKNEFNRVLELCYLDFRPFLMDPAVRAVYDQQLNWHESRDARARPYAEWRQEILDTSRAARLARTIRHRSSSLVQRAVENFRDSEYV